MGLDQYLKVKSKAENETARAMRSALGFIDDTHPPHVMFETTAIYWRKCYSISTWFYDHCELDRTDQEWPEFIVTHAHLQQLLNDCRKALAGDEDAIKAFGWDSQGLERNRQDWEYTAKQVEAVLVQFPNDKWLRPTFRYWDIN